MACKAKGEQVNKKESQRARGRDHIRKKGKKQEWLMFHNYYFMKANTQLEVGLGKRWSSLYKWQ
jgi:hypothetical protein